MAVGNDVFVGQILLGLIVSFLLYYTLWVIGLPLLEPSVFLHQYFPDNVYALSIPLSVLTLMVVVLALYSSWLMKLY